MWDEASRRITAIGMRLLRHYDSQMIFASPVDAEYSSDSGQGTLYAPGPIGIEEICGFELGPFGPIAGKSWKTHNPGCSSFRKA